MATWKEQSNSDNEEKEMKRDVIEALREERELMLALGRITSARKLMDLIQDLLRQAKSKKK